MPKISKNTEVTTHAGIRIIAERQKDATWKYCLYRPGWPSAVNMPLSYSTAAFAIEAAKARIGNYS